jgi:hypothetical protein
MKLHFRFDSAPGPQGPRLIEVEDADGNSVCAGTWEQDPASEDWFLVVEMDAPVTP